MIPLKHIVWIIDLLQPPQPLQPPRFIPIDGLQGLIIRCIILIDVPLIVTRGLTIAIHPFLGIGIGCLTNGRIIVVERYDLQDLNVISVRVCAVLARMGFDALSAEDFPELAGSRGEAGVGTREVGPGVEALSHGGDVEAGLVEGVAGAETVLVAAIGDGAAGGFVA